MPGWSKGSSPKESQGAVSSKRGWILRRPKQDIHYIKYTETLSEEEPYRLKIKLHVKYLPLKKIWEKDISLLKKKLDIDYRTAHDNLSHEIMK